MIKQEFILDKERSAEWSWQPCTWHSWGHNLPYLWVNTHGLYEVLYLPDCKM